MSLRIVNKTQFVLNIILKVEHQETLRPSEEAEISKVQPERMIIEIRTK